jgi:hypothetical protein
VAAGGMKNLLVRAPGQTHGQNIRVKSNLWHVIKANLSLAKNSHVAVGYPSDSPKAKNSHDTLSGMNNVQVALANELGSAPGVKPVVPARPFMKRTFDREGVKLLNAMRALAILTLKGKMSTHIALERIGRIAQSEVQRSFTAETWAPNARMTIALKGSSQPLIDKGTLRNSVSYKVRMKSGVK